MVSALASESLGDRTNPALQLAKSLILTPLMRFADATLRLYRLPDVAVHDRPVNRGSSLVRQPCRGAAAR